MERTELSRYARRCKWQTGRQVERLVCVRMKAKRKCGDSDPFAEKKLSIRFSHADLSSLLQSLSAEFPFSQEFQQKLSSKPHAHIHTRPRARHTVIPFRCAVTHPTTAQRLLW